MNTKDIVDVVAVPVTLALIALLWPVIQSAARRRAFQRLILRELEEISPWPEEPSHAGWWEHQSKRFLHQKIFAEPSDNRDFILSLDPNLVYFVSQLWQAKSAKDDAQWLYYLQAICGGGYDHHGKIADAHKKWVALCDVYRQRNT